MKRFFSIVCALVAFYCPLAAQANDTPTTMPGVVEVDADKVKQLLAKGSAVFDVRDATEYAEGHIKDTKSVPYKEKSAKDVDFDASLDKFDLSKLPQDKNAAIVFYCNGPSCWKSFKASAVAVKAGYKNIHRYRSGFPDWKAKGFPVE